MQQFYLCPQGHRWEAGPDASPESPDARLRCPVCGAEAETTAVQDLEAAAGVSVRQAAQGPAETSAFQDLEILAATAGAGRDRSGTTAFQDLASQSEGSAGGLDQAPPGTTAFQELPALPGDRDSRAITPGEPRALPPNRSTAVTLRFPGLRREALVKLLPTIPGYDVLEEVGRGPTSIVYKARETGLQRLVAIKVIVSGENAEARNFADLRARLGAAARLQHPCVAQVYQTGEYQGRPYLVLEYVDAGDLRQKLGGRPQPPYDAAQLTETLARTVAYAHEQDLLHLSLKPTNVLLTSDGLPKVADFGLARAPADSPVPVSANTGTNPSYLAPEQVTARRPVGPAADVYALGAILYEMLTGRPPFLAATAPETARLVRTEEPLMPRYFHVQVPPKLQTICLQCLRKDPAQRYATAQDLAEDLHNYLVDQPIRARPLGLAERVWGWSRRRPVQAAVIAVVAVTVCTLAAGGLRNRARLQAAHETIGEQRAAAEKQSRDTRRALYLADVGRAQQTWEQGNVAQAVQLLERHRDETDLRSFDWDYVWRACHSELRVLQGHAGPVHAVAFSPNGQSLATAGETRGDKDAVRGEVRLWDPATGKEWATLSGFKGLVLALAFHKADGRLLATAGQDGTIQLWDTLTGKQFDQLPNEPKPNAKTPPPKPHTGPVRALAFGPGERLLASGGADGLIKVWDIQTGKLLEELPGNTGGVSSLAFAPDGKTLVAATLGEGPASPGEIRLWDVNGWKERGVLRGHRGPVRSLAFSGDGKTLVSGGGLPDTAGEVKLWDLPTARLRQDVPGAFDPVTYVAVTADGRTVAVACGDAVVQLVNLEGYPQTPVRLQGHTAPVLGLAFAGAGRMLATAGGDATARLWSVPDALGGATLRGHTQPIHGLALAASAKGLRLASVAGEADKAGEVKVWNVDNGTELLSIGAHERSVLATALSPDGKTLATGSEDTQVRLFDLDTRRSRLLQGHTHWVSAVAFSPNGNLVASGGWDTAVRVWERATGRPVRNLPGHLHHVLAVAFSPDGRLLATADAGRLLKVWDLELRTERWSVNGHAGAVTALAFAPDGATLASGGDDHVVRLWDVAERTERAALQGHANWVTALAYDPDGKTLASASRDGTVRLWDPASGATRAVLQGHNGWVTAVAFSPDGKALASGGYDQTVRVWQAAR